MGGKGNMERSIPGYAFTRLVPSHFSRVQLCVTLWTVACQASLSKNTGVDYHDLLQGIFLTQGSNPCLLCLLH